MSKHTGCKSVFVIVRKHGVLVYQKWLWNSLINIFISIKKNYSFGGQPCMPDWLLIVSKIESSFKGKIFVNIGNIQTWRAFPKGNCKMKNCTISCLWNNNIILPVSPLNGTAFLWTLWTWVILVWEWQKQLYF